jgi:hypothetical protein
MRTSHRLYVLLALWAAPAMIAAAPLPERPKGPSPDAVKQVETRRAQLQGLGEYWQVDPADRRIQEGLDRLAAALRSADEYVVKEALRDWINGEYRGFPKDKILDALLLCLKRVPRGEDPGEYGHLMYYMSRQYGPKARAALPDLMKMVADENMNEYLRRQAIFAAAQIAPGEKEVVDAFLAILNNRDPKRNGGFYIDIAEHLGNMGKSARPAKAALERMLTLDHQWYRDAGYIALGKIAMDEPPLPLSEYLDRLKRLDKLPADQASAAFLHVHKAINPTVPFRGSNVHGAFADLSKIDRPAAETARPVVWAVARGRRDSTTILAALRLLNAIGPGSGQEDVRFLIETMLRPHTGENSEIRAEVMMLLAMVAPLPKEAATDLSKALAKILDEKEYSYERQLLAQTLARMGKDARVAVPVLLWAVRKYSPKRNFPGVFGSYVEALTAVGAEPGVRQLLLDSLDPTSPLLKDGSDSAPYYRTVLLTGLDSLGWPAEGPERTLLLQRVREALTSDQMPVYSAAAHLVLVGGKQLHKEEARPLVPLLVRVLGANHQFIDLEGAGATRIEWDRATRAAFGQRESNKALAIRALGTMGASARDALPALRSLAVQKEVPVTSTYIPEPSINHLIREARKAVAAIEK